MGLKALVTGGTGFIGSNLIEELIRRSWQVYAVIRRNSTGGYKRLEKFNDINYIYADEIIACNRGEGNKKIYTQASLPQFDVCFHLASYGVDYRQQNVNEMIDANIKFTMNILEFCKINKARKIINTGSCFEYGINNGRKLLEEDKLNPQTYYSVTKVAAEYMANIFAKNNNLNLITIRPFGVFGEGEGLHRFIPQLMKSMILKEKVNMTYGEQIRDYLYVKDLIAAYITLALHKVPEYEAYNVCSGNEIKVKDIAFEALKISNNDKGLLNLGALEYRKNEVMYLVGDNSKIKQYTDWEPEYSLGNGLRKTYEWYKANLKEIL